MFFVRHLEKSSAGGKFYRLRGTIYPSKPFDKVKLYGRKGFPPKHYKYRPEKSYFLWSNEKWKSFLRRNIGLGEFYCYYSGGFYVSAFVIRRRENKIKIKKKMKGIILPLFLGPVN